MSNTGDDNNTGDKEKEAPVNTNGGGNTASNTSGGPFSSYNIKICRLVTIFPTHIPHLRMSSHPSFAHFKND
uniref:Uncharacterized protein n=1 Tax=Oryza rufipogon TaxID=4529 RepID=A0A0E0R758_ORYRU